jgi:hypothetical protein
VEHSNYRAFYGAAQLAAVRSSVRGLNAFRYSWHSAVPAAEAVSAPSPLLLALLPHLGEKHGKVPIAAVCRDPARLPQMAQRKDAANLAVPLVQPLPHRPPTITARKWQTMFHANTPVARRRSIVMRFDCIILRFYNSICIVLPTCRKSCGPIVLRNSSRLMTPS